VPHGASRLLLRASGPNSNAFGAQGPPRLTKAGYYTQPCAEQLAALPDTALAALVGFAVGRTGYGLIEWEGARPLVSPCLMRRARLVCARLTRPQARWTCAGWTWTRW
jgi:hypothetical protein